MKKIVLFSLLIMAFMCTVASAEYRYNELLADGLDYYSGSAEWTDGGNYLIPTDANKDVQIDGDLSVEGDLTVAQRIVAQGTGNSYIQNGNFGIATDNPTVQFEQVSGDMSISNLLKVDDSNNNVLINGATS